MRSGADDSCARRPLDMLTSGSALCRASTRERALEALAAFLESASLADDVLDRCSSPVTLLLQRFAPVRAARHCCSLLHGLQAVQQASSVPDATLLEAVQSQAAWCRRDTLLLLCVRSVRSGGGGEAALAARALALLAVTLGAGDASERCAFAPPLPLWNSSCRACWM